jgi:copper transport protein
VASTTIFLVFAAAPVASAHATAVSTDPNDGAVLAAAPSAVSVSFDESVSVTSDSLRVFDPAGVRADAGGATHGGRGSVLTVLLRPGLLNGTYVAAWRVVSADSHPVQGAFTFSIGSPSASAVDLSSVNPPADRTVDVLYDVARFLAFAGFAVLVGAVAFLALCWPAGADRYEALAVVERGWALLALGSLGALLLQGVYGSGAPLTHATHPQLLEATLESPLGVALSVRVGVLILLVPFRNRLSWLAVASDRARARFAVVWGVLGAGLGATWAAADHAAVGIQAPAAIVADSAHLLALACWIGGLAMLALVVLRGTAAGAEGETEAGSDGETEAGTDAEGVRAAVPRFSRLATISVAVIATTGLYQAWRGVGSLGALTGTAYGRLVSVKVVAFAGLLTLGYLSRRAIPRLSAATAAAPGIRRLRRTVTAEALIAAFVLFISALLVNTRTGRESAVAAPPPVLVVPFDTGGPGGRGTVQAELTPARPGRNQLRLVLLGSDRRSYAPAELTASLGLPARGIGALKVTLADAGPGAYTATVTDVALPGAWTLSVTIRSDAIDETTVRIPVPIR